MRQDNRSGYLGAQFGEGDPEDSMNFNYDSNVDYASQQPQQAPSSNAGSTTAAAGAGFAAGGPAGAAISVGGQFLTQYLAAKAAEERQKRDMAMKNQQDYAQNQNSAFGNEMSAYARALR